MQPGGGTSVIIKTGRFGQLSIKASEQILFPNGILGFPDLKKFCLVDPGDDTLIVWLQSLDEPSIAFPALEPKIFKPEYAARLSAHELRDLKLEMVHQSAVFSILTIPEDVSQMTANLKAPIVINLKEQIAKQVVLQEAEYSIQHSMFKELRAHLVTLQSVKKAASEGEVQRSIGAIVIGSIPPSLTVRSLNV
jgi:flagellar assembly factor FliW